MYMVWHDNKCLKIVVGFIITMKDREHQLCYAGIRKWFSYAFIDSRCDKVCGAV